MHYIKLPSKSKKAFLSNKKFKLFYSKILPVLAVCGFVLFIILRLLGGTSSYISDSPLNLIFDRGPNINSADNKVNILLLGNAGGIHDGAMLTDTVIVASLNYKTNKVYLISLPRDLWVEEVKGKINSVYERAGDDENGLPFSKKVIGEVLGLPIHYAVRVNFNGFVKAIDEVGGIDVEVEKSFDDYLYPIAGKEDDLCGFTEQEKEFTPEEAKQLNIEPGKKKVLIAPDGKIATDSAEPDKGYEYFNCRYEHISFKKGLTTLDGETALKYVRSRMGSNGEGSDFARSRRQQRVLDALRGKVLSVETLVNPAKISSLINIFGDSFSTDLDITDMLELYKLVKKVETTSSFVISNSGPEPLLIHPGIGEYGAWVLVPKDRTFNEIRNYIKKVLTGEVTNDEATAAARTRNN